MNWLECITLGICFGGAFAILFYFSLDPSWWLLPFIAAMVIYGFYFWAWLEREEQRLWELKLAKRELKWMRRALKDEKSPKIRAVIRIQMDAIRESFGLEEE